MFTKRDRNEIREIRHARVRKKISGTPDMPRLSVYRSLKHIQVQLIDDVAGKTLCAASTLEKDVQAQLNDLDKKGAAKLVGKLIGERALAAGYKTRGVRSRRLCVHWPCCGGCCGAREAGLEF